ICASFPSRAGEIERKRPWDCRKESMKPYLAFFLFLMILTHAPAKDSRPAAPVLPDSHAQVFSFDNGLTLIVDEDHSAPVASVQAWCATGSINEGKWMGAGLSHILE